jgi:hypothetical protein
LAHSILFLPAVERKYQSNILWSLVVVLVVGRLAEMLMPVVAVVRVDIEREH